LISLQRFVLAVVITMSAASVDAQVSA
jgi:hypothetical protein